jgi:hypothetical protein
MDKTKPLAKKPRVASKATSTAAAYIQSSTYLLSICTNTQIDVTKGPTTDPLGNAVFLQAKNGTVLEGRHHGQQHRDPF